MPFIIRPSGDNSLANATIHADTGLPLTISGLTAGSYEVGRIEWSSLPATATDLPVPVAVTAPGMTGNGKIGSTQTGVDAVWSLPPDSTERRWTRNGTAISGATGASYLPVAADDQTSLRYEQRARKTSGTWSAWAQSNLAGITLVAPAASGTLPDKSFIEKTGVQSVATASGFTGQALAFSLVSAPSGVSINASTGVISIDTAATGVVSKTSLTVKATNSGGQIGQAFNLTVASAGNTTAPILSNVHYVDSTKALSFDLNEASTVVWATADKSAAPTYAVGGGWAATTYQTGSFSAPTPGNVMLSLTSATPNGARELTLFAYNAAGSLSTAQRIAITVSNATVPAAMVGGTHFAVIDTTTGGAATISFIAAPSHGGSAITGYQYRIGTGGTWTNCTFPQTVTGLTNGVATDLYCRAQNTVGSGPDSTPHNVTTSGGVSYINVLHKPNDQNLYVANTWTGAGPATPWHFFNGTPQSVTALGSDWFRILSDAAANTDLDQDNLAGRSGFTVASAAARWFMVWEMRLSKVGTAQAVVSAELRDVAGGGDYLRGSFNLSTGTAIKTSGASTIFGMTDLGSGEYRCWLAIDKVAGASRLIATFIKTLNANQAVEIRRGMLTAYAGDNANVPTWIDGQS